jgi:hypothetical protein
VGRDRLLALALGLAAPVAARVGGRLFVAAEGKVTAAYAWIPVQDGSATLSNLAFHGLVGTGYGR